MVQTERESFSSCLKLAAKLAGGMLGTSLLAELIFRTDQVVDVGNPVGFVKELTEVKGREVKMV